MPAQTTAYLDHIADLPAGKTLRFAGVSWEDYEQLLDELGDAAGVRVSYDHGRMEIMAPLPIHEIYKSLVHEIITLLSVETGVDVEALGSTTLKRQLRERGAEPDECFYVRNAAAVVGIEHLDLDRVPPPDVVVEIDIASHSQSKLPIYAALGVPEAWRYDGSRGQMYALDGMTYREIDASLAFPMLTRQALEHDLALAASQGQSAARRAFQAWVRGLNP